MKILSEDSPVHVYDEPRQVIHLAPSPEINERMSRAVHIGVIELANTLSLGN